MTNATTSPAGWVFHTAQLTQPTKKPILSACGKHHQRRGRVGLYDAMTL